MQEHITNLYNKLLHLHHKEWDRDIDDYVEYYQQDGLKIIKTKAYINHKIKTILFVEDEKTLPYSVITPQGQVTSSSQSKHKAIHPNCDLYEFDDEAIRTHIHIWYMRGYDEYQKKITKRYLIQVLDSKHDRHSHDIQN